MIEYPPVPLRLVSALPLGVPAIPHRAPDPLTGDLADALILIGLVLAMG